MRKFKLTKEEREIERAIENGEFVPMKRTEFLKHKKLLQSAAKADLKRRCVLKAPVRMVGGSWSAQIEEMGFYVAEKSVPKLQASLKRILEEMVGEKGFSVRVEGRTRKPEHFLVIPSHPELLRPILDAKKKKFNTRSKVIKRGPVDGLSIGLDFDLNPLKPYPVILFVPNENEADHFHICLSNKEAQAMRDWLDGYLSKAGQPFRG